MYAADPRHQFGHASEMRAEQFLIAKGYRILDRNVRLSIGELDLVADDHGVVVFVEVKGRSTEAFGGALSAVDRRKRTKLSKLAALYLAQRHWSDKLCRFDVVLVQGQPSAPEQIEHIPNAFDITES
ncbi:MAG: YraN family protein [Nitrospira sp.]|nr:YraN family protein [Nitrospira sp.]MDH4303088.1 YraN family protein [Nitrospira sp.]MDH5192266.1 YraN family protein [Nitrospira sp.]